MSGWDDQVREEIEAISIAGQGLWRNVQGQPPEIIYHYTNADGLIGIISSSSLWATDLRFVNDASELDHALEVMRVGVERARTRFTSPSHTLLLDRLEAAIGARDGFPSVHSVSFSANGDLLSQWRAYGGQSGGYAIGFAALDLRPEFGSGIPTPGGSVHRVIYDPKLQDELFDGVIAKGCELIGRLADKGEDTEVVANGLIQRLLSGSESGLFYCLKGEGWAEESEWRTVYALASGQMSHVEFRTVAGIPVPYLPLADRRQRLPIREVIVGPSAPARTAESAVESLLKRYDYTDVPTKRSELPLRW